MLPGISEEVLDGQLGALPPGTGTPLAVIAVATAGTVNSPAAFARKQFFPQNFGYGPGVEFSALAVETTSVPVLFTRATANVAGAAGAPVVGAYGSCTAPVKSGTGTFTPTIDTNPRPDAVYYIKVIFPLGGTLGTGPIVYQVGTSSDAGVTYTYDEAVSLGVAKSIDLSSYVGGACTLILTTGTETIVDDDSVTFHTTAPVIASAGTLDVTHMLGGADVTISTSGGTPNDDYDYVLKFPTGGVIGTDTDITYQESFDGGRTFLPVKAIPTPVATTTTITPENGGGWTVAVGSPGNHTINDGDYATTRTTAPNFDGTSLTAALAALAATRQKWDGLVVVGALDATTYGVLDAWAQAQSVAGKPCRVVGHYRMPALNESHATWGAAFTAEMGALASADGVVVLGGRECLQVSAVSGRNYRRPNIFAGAVGARLLTCSPEVDLAMVDPPGGPLTGANIRDVNGNPVYHDEDYQPGDDDLRILALRTWSEFEGVYLNRPRTFCPDGSDFTLLPRGRVFDYARKINRAFFLRKLSNGIPADKKTGFIKPDVAKAWEKAAEAAVNGALMPKGMASGATVTIRRNDNLLALNAIMHVEFRMTPLIYVEQIQITSAMRNPANG